MLPTPLQAVPLSQRELAWQLTVALGQHWAVLVQVSPLTRQPLATAHTGTPEPRSMQICVQQSFPLVQGTPSWPQLVAPVVSVQRPTVPPARSHTLLQQSELAWQMSP